MTGVGDEPQYDAFADAFAEHARDGFYNAHYDRPACLSLLGDVAGRHVLDVGCGPGWYATELASRGARVTAFDLSPRMVELTRARVPDADVRVHDAAAPLGWLPDGSIDLALWALGLEYVDDRVGALSELRRVLRPGEVAVGEQRVELPRLLGPLEDRHEHPHRLGAASRTCEVRHRDLPGRTSCVRSLYDGR